MSSRDDCAILASEGFSRLERAFFERPTVEVARSLIGCLLYTATPGGLCCGRVVETEAYLGPDDPASHAALYKRGRVAAMAGPCGIAYVYRSYGIHAMLNPVAHSAGGTGAVLIRAIEPLIGLDLMRRRRGVGSDRLLCSGPGRLCQALGVSLDDHGEDLVTSERIWLTRGTTPATIAASGRIGITRACDVPWRFFEVGNRSVSSHRRGVTVVMSDSDWAGTGERDRG